MEATEAENSKPVVRVFDTHLGRDVACKFALHTMPIEDLDGEQHECGLSDEDNGLSESMLQIAAAMGGRYDLLREARLLAMVRHPNVLPVLEMGRFDRRMVALLLPYLDGGTAATRDFSGPWDKVLETALQIGRGVEALHDAGILHRDLKPNNIVFDHDGWPYVADLGLSCRFDEISAMRERVGTMAYMPPGVFELGFEDARDDLYAFCMIVFEMFYGRPPFDSQTDRDRGRVAEVTRKGGMPPGLHVALVRGLAPARADRWPNMHVLLQRMEGMRRRPARRWLWPVAATSLAAGVAMGILIDEGTAQADSCAQVTDELSKVWNPEIQAGLTAVFGTRKAGDALDDWARRWLEVRAQECAAAEASGSPMEPTPCSASTRDRFAMTMRAFQSPRLRAGLQFASVIAELPAPEHCIDHPDDADWGYGGLLELRDLDVEIDILTRSDDLELARAAQAEYMKVALDSGSEIATARATYFRAEILRLEGKSDEAASVFDLALERAIALDAHEFTAECLLGLAMLAGARGDLGVVDAYAHAARKLFERYRPQRIAELLQVQGLALVAGAETDRERGLELLQRAVEMREDELRRQTGSRQWLSMAHESYGRGLLAVGRAGEAIEHLDLALNMHQDEYGHGTWRTRVILMAKFLALVELRRFDDATLAQRRIFTLDVAAENWQRYIDDAWWFAQTYEEKGEYRAAATILRDARLRAVAHGLEAEVIQLDLAVERLAGPSN